MADDTPATHADFQALAAEIRELGHAVTAVAGRAVSAGHGHATISVNLGGFALWLSATCCAVMLACLIPLALALYWVAMDSRDRGHQMNALYMSVPGLRELVDRQQKQNEQTTRRPQEPNR